MARGFLSGSDYIHFEKLSESQRVVFPCRSPADDSKVMDEIQRVARNEMWFGRVAVANSKNTWDSEYMSQFDDSAKKETMRQQIASVPPVYTLKRFK